MSKILVSGGLVPTTKDTLLDARTRVATFSEIANIENPARFMVITVEDTGKKYEVKKLSSKIIGGIVVENSTIDINDPEALVDLGLAEELRSEEEKVRQSNEKKRIEAENLRKSAEDSRNVNETNRVSAEGVREASERTRVSSEETRNANEQTRNSNEIKRQSQESTRQSQESARQANESTRNTNESARKEAESERKTKETSRRTAELSRSSAENERVKNEQNRTTAENTRSSAEDRRVVNETQRTTNETARSNAELSRKQAEGNRASTFNTLKGQMQTTIQEGQTAVAATEKATSDAQKVVDNYDTKVAEQDSKLTELGSEVGRGVLTLNLTENHSSTVDVIPINLKSGDNIIIGIEANSGVKGCSVYFYNSQTGESKPYGLTLNKSTIITVDSDYDEMGLWVEISNEATITMKYYSRSAISSFLNSGVMGIIGSDGGTSYPDVNTKTGEMIISKNMGIIVNGVYISIPPQTFSLKNGVGSSLVKIVLNINTKICTAKIYDYALGANEIVIGTARVKWTSDGSFSELYHVYFPFEYSIDGETVNSKFASLFSDMNNSYFIGDDSNFVSTKFRGFVGRRYEITPIYKTWEIPSDLGNVSIFYIGAHTKSGSGQQLFAANTFSAIKDSYIIEYLEEYNDIYIGGRASKGNKVFFQIEDITEASAKDTFLLVGNDNTGVTAKVLLCKDVEYEVRLPEERWDISNINIGYAYYYYELYYSDADGKTVVLNGNLSNGIYINKFSFVAPETKEYTIYIRANKGVKVPIFILPQISSRHENQLDKARCLGFARNPNSSYIPNLTFMHMSDTHCTNSVYQDSFKKSVTLFNKISGGEKNQGNALKFILHTGDTRNHSFNDGFDFFEKITKGLKGNIYITPGNHDVGFGDDATKAGTDEQIYLQMIAPQLNKWQLNSDGTDLPHTEGKNYYFNDFTDEKVRLIVLYEYETDLELMEGNTSKLKYSRDFRAFRQAQIDWFIQTLKNTPQGYGVIIAKHQPESFDGFTDNPFYSNMLTETTHMQSYCGTELIAQIVQAFIDRTVFSTTIQQTGGVVTTLNIVANFSNLASSEFICYCSGHTHLDMITKLKNYPKQMELNIGANNTHYTNGSDIYQNGEGVTELLTNVYSIDRNRGCIYVVRIGANFSNTAQLRDFISLKYK